MALTFSGSGDIRFTEILWLKKVFGDFLKAYFSGFTLRPASFSLLKTSSRCVKWLIKFSLVNEKIIYVQQTEFLFDVSKNPVYRTTESSRGIG